MNIVDRERTLYEDVFDSIEKYKDHSPGEMFAAMFEEMIEAPSGEARAHLSVLDAGCGTGKGALALSKMGFRVQMCDITPNGLVEEAQSLPFSEACLWFPLGPQIRYLFGGKVDYVVCCDVLEHIPREYTMLTVARLLEVTGCAAFLSISLVRDNFGIWLGKPLHQTVEGFVWWRDNLNTVGEVIEARDLLNTGVYLVKPRGFRC